MKKLNFLKLMAVSLTVISFFSCKSTPDLNPVDPFELLDGDGVLYLTIPVQANIDLVASAIQKVASASESDAKKIAERLDVAYVSLGTNMELQLSASGKIPQSFLGVVLSEKKGWNGSIIEQQTVYTHKTSLYQLCLPSSSNAFLSHNIEPMVKRYNKISYLDSESSEKLISETLPPGIYNFLHDVKSTEIVMFSSAPKMFARAFLGTEFNMPVNSFAAVLSQDRGVLDEYNVKFIINLNDARTVKAMSALLKTALFGVPAKIAQTGEKQITITDLPISKKRLLSIIR